MAPLVLYVYNRVCDDLCCFLLQTTPVFIGRDPVNTIVLDLPCVSQWQFVITRGEERIYLRLMSAASATFIAGRALRDNEVVELKAGAAIRTGPFILSVGTHPTFVAKPTAPPTGLGKPFLVCNTEDTGEYVLSTEDLLPALPDATAHEPMLTANLEQVSSRVMREIAEDWVDVACLLERDGYVEPYEIGLSHALEVCARTLSSLRRLEGVLSAGRSRPGGTLLDTVVRVHIGGASSSNPRR